MVRSQPFAFLVGDHRGFGNAEQRVMRLVEIAIGKIGVVGRNERQIVTVRQLDQAWLCPRLIRCPVTHQLDIEPVRKQARELGQDGLGGFCLALRQKPADRASRPAGQAKEPLVGLAPGPHGLSPARSVPHPRDRIG